MTGALLLAWGVAGDGLLGRAEIRLDRAALDGHPSVVEAVLEAAAAQAQARSAWTGATVLAACGRRACTVAVEGLQGVLPVVQAEVEAALLARPHLSCPTRRALRHRWRARSRAPGVLLDAATLLAVGDPATATYTRAAQRPRTGSAALGAIVDSLRAAHPPVPPGELGPPIERAWVDWPGEARARVVVAWASTGHGDELVRDAWLAGDFESRLVQLLREEAGLTYDVEPDAGPGWAAATFDVAGEDVAEAVVLASRTLGERPGPAEIDGAYRRLRARAASAADTLAGSLAALPGLPPAAPGALPSTSPRAVVVVGDARHADASWRVLDRCYLLFGGACPP